MATLFRQGLTSLFGGRLTVNRIYPSVYPIHQSRQLSDDTMKKFKALKVEEVKPFVYHVQLNRPEKMNALNKTLWGEIGEAFRELGNDPDCRVVVFSGNGKMFCSGIDLNDFVALGSIIQSDTDAARKARNLYPVIRQYQLDFLEIEKCPKPVIFAVHNACVGGATNMICFGDIRYCTKDAWFQVKETALGLAADVGVLQYLPKIVSNQSLVRELCYTARKIPSDEAEKMGLVSRVFEDKEALMKGALDLAEIIAAMSPVAVQTTKINLNYARDNKVDDSLDFAARYNMVCLQTDDLLKAAMAQMTKSPEPPTFSKL